MKLSLCMIVKNEENNLPRCLDSVKDIVDEMIIVDTGSTDNTVNIAKKYGASVYCFKWNDHFSDARNFSMDKAKGDWILIMDADDELNVSDKSKIRPLLDNDNVDIYLFQTLSYVGERASLDTASNLSVKLIRNKQGYRYEGAIHEQIKNKDIIDKERVKAEDIIVYHYGYIKDIATEKCKSKRNIRILEKILENDGEDNFHLFNMGNEYLRLRDYKKALEFYFKAYEKFKPYGAHSPKLLVRMIIALDALNKYDEVLVIINEGLKYYPNFTDLVYLKGTMLHRRHKLLPAAKAFKKCIDMGEPPLYLKFINDVGGFKSYYAMGEIYYELEDYDGAYHYYIEAIKSKPEFHIPLYRIAEILINKGKSKRDIKDKLEKFFQIENVSAYMILGDIFFTLQEHDFALEYFLKAEAMTFEKHSKILYYEGLCRLFLKNYKEAYICFEEIDQKDIYYSNAIYNMILCKIFSGEIDHAVKLLDRAKDFNKDKIYLVYETLLKILQNNHYSLISDKQEEGWLYAEIIINLLGMILKASSPEIFEQSLELLNLIESDEILLRLGKLYYYHGYYDLAYQEFIRSIKLFDKIDHEGLGMMKRILIRKSP